MFTAPTTPAALAHPVDQLEHRRQRTPALRPACGIAPRQAGPSKAARGAIWRCRSNMSPDAHMSPTLAHTAHSPRSRSCSHPNRGGARPTRASTCTATLTPRTSLQQRPRGDSIFVTRHAGTSVLKHACPNSRDNAHTAHPWARKPDQHLPTPRETRSARRRGGGGCTRTGASATFAVPSKHGARDTRRRVLHCSDGTRRRTG
jgi:hypothetical protein